MAVWRPGHLLLVLLALWSVIICVCDSVRISFDYNNDEEAPMGDATSFDSFKFLGRFVFAKTGGHVGGTLNINAATNPGLAFDSLPRISFFYGDNWDMVYKINPGIPCEDKERLGVTNSFSFPPSITAAKFVNTITCSPSLKEVEKNRSAFSEDNITTYSCQFNIPWDSLKIARFFFTTISCCECPPNVLIKGELHFTNQKITSLQEFSADENWILIVVIVALICNSVLLFMQSFVEEKYSDSTESPVVISIHIAVLGLYEISLVMYAWYYGKIGSSGRPPSESVMRMADFTWVLGDVLFICLLILLAKGYCIFRRTLRQSSVLKLLTYLFLVFIAYVTVLYVERHTYDPGEIRWRYGTMWGLLLASILLAGWFYFAYALSTSLGPCCNSGGNQNNVDPMELPGNAVVAAEPRAASRETLEAKQKPFMIALGITFTIWLWVQPLYITLGGNIGENHRANITALVWHTQRIVGYSIITLLWWPTWRTRFFPFTHSSNSIIPVIQYESQELAERQDETDIDALVEQQVHDIMRRRRIFSPRMSGVSDNELAAQMELATYGSLASRARAFELAKRQRDAERNNGASIPNMVSDITQQGGTVISQSETESSEA